MRFTYNMKSTTTQEQDMTITLDNQHAFNNRTADEVTLNGEFEIVEFHKTERYNGLYTETAGHWTVQGVGTTYSFSRVFPASGRVDFSAATDYDLTNI
jgi:hypothetical protein